MSPEAWVSKDEDKFIRWYHTQNIDKILEADTPIFVLTIEECLDVLRSREKLPDNLSQFIIIKPPHIYQYKDGCTYVGNSIEEYKKYKKTFNIIDISYDFKKWLWENNYEFNVNHCIRKIRTRKPREKINRITNQYFKSFINEYFRQIIKDIEVFPNVIKPDRYYNTRDYQALFIKIMECKKLGFRRLPSFKLIISMYKKMKANKVPHKLKPQLIEILEKEIQ